MIKEMIVNAGQRVFHHISREAVKHAQLETSLNHISIGPWNEAGCSQENLSIWILSWTLTKKAEILSVLGLYRLRKIHILQKDIYESCYMILYFYIFRNTEWKTT